MSNRLSAFSFLMLFIISSFACIHAQNLLNQPESVVFDAPHERYLVSNYANGNIVAIDDAGNQTYFDTTLTRIAGLTIKGDTLLVASNLAPYNGLVGYDLNADTMLFFVPIPSVGLLNDLAYDTSGNVYITDYWDNKLFRVDLNTLSYSLFVDPIQAPNGIYCDIANNRLLVILVGVAGDPLGAVDLSDSSMSIAIYTYIHSMDGIAADNLGRIYLSSWYSNSCFRFDSLVNCQPVEVSTGHDGPADISINLRDNILCVPNFYRNDVDFVNLGPSDIIDNPAPDKYCLARNYPNPFNASTTIEYDLSIPAEVSINIYDIRGGKVTTLLRELQLSGSHKAVWDAGSFASGIYYYRICADGYSETGRMTLLK
jgi:DNA-binding beta-propeller fold protein YncE